MRNKMKTFTLALSFFLVNSADAQTGVLSFQAWKTSRVDEAQGVLDRLSQDISVEKPSQVDRGTIDKVSGIKTSVRGSDRGTETVAKSLKNGRPDQRIQQANLNLEIAREHSVNDYFVLYLSQFKQRDVFLEAAKKMTPEETADLLVSYQRNLQSVDQSESSGPVGLNASSADLNKKPTRTGL